MAKLDKGKLWTEVLSSVKVSVTAPIYSTWLTQTFLQSLKKVGKDRYRAEVGCNSSFVKQTIEQRYYGLIQDTLIQSLGSPCEISFVVSSISHTEDKITGATPLFNSRPAEEELMEKITKANIRPGFTFDNFAVSGTNQMAWAAAEASARQPGVAYNPLFMYGGVGVGKTHIMHAVGHKMLSERAEFKVLACSSEEFANDIIEGIRNKTTQRFRERYRRLDALFVDDIQFIAGKNTIQEEFFHTFNAVISSGGQIILTSDKPPNEIPKLEQRLQSRFEAGLIVDIAEPNFELRCAIVQIKSKERGIPLTSDHVNLIAGNIESARKIEGFLIRLSSELKVKKAYINEDFIKGLINKGAGQKDLVRARKAPEQIIDAVCLHFAIRKRAILSKARSRVIARPRQILMYILRTELQLSLEEVGRIVGGRDHSTVIHGVDRITKLSSEHVDIREDILRIKNSVWG